MTKIKKHYFHPACQFSTSSTTPPTVPNDPERLSYSSGIGIEGGFADRHPLYVVGTSGLLAG